MEFSRMKSRCLADSLSMRQNRLQTQRNGFPFSAYAHTDAFHTDHLSSRRKPTVLNFRERFNLSKHRVIRAAFFITLYG